ncbi:MAG: 50S ribosomal protein L32 [Planctomycetota bacterium]
MPVPKRKRSKSRNRHRRANHKLPIPAVTICSHCRRNIMPHRVCDYCGYYRNEKVLDIKAG